MVTEPPASLLSRLSEPDARAVLGDWLAERGRERSLQATIAALEICYADAAADDVDAAADDADAAADDADAVAADADAADADDVAVAADADAADADDVAADFFKNQLLWVSRENEMRNGLALVVVAGGWRALTRVGWLRRVEGDEWELVGARSVRTVGRYIPLAELASIGPVKDVSLQQKADEPEPLHRLLLRRVIFCDVPKWAKEVPRPKGWDE